MATPFKRSLRLGWLIPLLGLAWPLLAGCGLANMPTPEPVTITFTYPEIDNRFYEPLVPLFLEENPGIIVNLDPRPDNALDNIDPDQTDVIAMGVYELGVLQSQGGILGLNSVIEGDKTFEMSDYLPGTVDFLALDGETWAIPVGADLDVMYYNRDLFDQHALPYPQAGWDWDDFLLYALTINDPEALPARVFGYTTVPGYQDVYSFIYQHGGKLFDDLKNPREPAFNDPLTVEAVEFYADLFYRYQVAPTLTQAQRDFGGHQYAVYDLIRRGQIGLWPLSLSQRAGYGWPMEWDMNWGIAPLPQDAIRFAPFWVEEGYAISSGTSSPDECWRWINFITWQINPRLIPARRSLVESDGYLQVVGEDVATLVRQSLEFAVPVSIWQWINLGSAIDTFNRAIEDIVERQASPRDTLDAAQERASGKVP
jgi:multiple sugar transport system substrate-binding protein